MGSLDGVVFYLAGSIDKAKDDGIAWRQDIRNSVKGMGIRFIDPSDKPLCFRKEVVHEKMQINDLKQIGKWKAIKNRVNDFAKHDHRGVDISDCLILYVDIDVHACGSYFEVERAYLQDKPLLLIVKDGLINCPPWLFSKFPIEQMFNSVADCVAYLEELDKHVLPESWVLMKDWLSFKLTNDDKP